MLILRIRPVNFIVNIFTDFPEEYKTIGENIFEDITGSPLSLSISDNIINSPSLAVNLSALSGYKNVFTHVEDSIIQSGRFIFTNKGESFKPMEHIANIVEMNNVFIFKHWNYSIKC